MSGYVFETMVQDSLDYSEAQRRCEDYLSDPDGDGIYDAEDNCEEPNSDQADLDHNGVGDACE